MLAGLVKRRVQPVGVRARERREELGLSQVSVAEAAGMRYQALARIERGEADNPTLKTLRALAAALSWTVAELIGETRIDSGGGSAD